MTTRVLEIKNSRPVVSLTRPDTSAGDFFHQLLINGDPSFEFGAPCGTCGVLFQKLHEPDQRLTDERAAVELGDLASLPDKKALQNFSALLGTGTYTAAVFSGKAECVEPGASHDFFREHYARLHSWEIDDDVRPGTPYYRFGATFELPRVAWMKTWPGLLLSMIVPLFDPSEADEERVQHWIAEAQSGIPLTAVAVGVVDQQEPATEGGVDPTYPFREHRAIIHYLLDGHHRALAAARLGHELRVLSFVSAEASMAQSPVFEQSIERLAD